MQLRSAQFTIETLDNQRFEGYAHGQEWNGWACPLFDFDQAQQLVKAYQQQNQNAYYDQALDAFIFVDDVVEEQEEFGVLEMDGRKLYAIGAGAWIWEEVM